jgi:CRP/FNR family nitrogen fixation transcriptional regulator
LNSSYSYEKNEKIYTRDEAATYVYQVATGAIRIFSELNDGHRQIGSFYFPGDIFGLEPGPRYRWSAEAVVAATTVHRVRHKAFVRKAHARSLWNITMRDLLRAEDHSVVLGLLAPERVAAFLLEMNSRLGVDGEITLPMSRSDIADYLGLTIETVAREISKFSDEGLLRRNGPGRTRRLSVRRPERLLAMLPRLSALDLPPISDPVIQKMFSS